MKLTSEQQDLVDFAYRINRRMGANLQFLLNFGVVYMSDNTAYYFMLEHLRTNKNFGLVTGFEHNPKSLCIWLDTEKSTLKDIYRSRRTI